MILIIDKKTLQIVSSYEGNEPRQSDFGGTWANPELFEHKKFEGEAEVAKARRDGETIVVEVDEAKKAELDSKRARRGRIDDRNLSAEDYLKTHYDRAQASQFEKAVIELILKEKLEPKEVKNG